eukprot:2487312-Rhodomonas_salina.1
MLCPALTSILSPPVHAPPAPCRRSQGNSSRAPSVMCGNNTASGGMQKGISEEEELESMQVAAAPSANSPPNTQIAGLNWTKSILSCV